jgi:hypothetical protein
MRFILAQVSRDFWLRRRSVLSQCLVTWARKVLIASLLSGTA